MGATEAKVAAAYQCAMALREPHKEPCILRRTKAECMDTLRLLAKQEQVLFCHLTPEQTYQLYVQFLKLSRSGRPKSVSLDRKMLGAVFLPQRIRKLCNHPDLLAQVMQ
ncbi:unnamed protein product [Effrenium voratum]|nr:unnamed protein product [Effrenium voratum]